MYFVSLLYIGNQNTSKMYIIIDKTTQESYIIKEKTVVSSLIGKSTSTIYRNEGKKCWQTDKFTIYNPIKVLIKSAEGVKVTSLGKMFCFDVQNTS